jgi:hypothetical protein
MYEYVPALGSLGVEVATELTSAECEATFENSVVCSSISRLGDAKAALRQAVATREELPEACEEVRAALEEAALIDRVNVSDSVWSELERVSLDVALFAVGSGCTVSGTAAAAVGDPRIRLLQQEIVNAAGCALPEHGIDGIWGPETRAGTQCLLRAKGQAFVSSKFPFVADLMGAITPAPTTIAPLPVPLPTASPTPIHHNWWFWVAVVGIGAVGAVGVKSYMEKKKWEEEGVDFEDNPLPPFAAIGPVPHPVLGAIYNIGARFL